MAIDTKPNLNSEKFEQTTLDSLNLSGVTNVYNSIRFMSGSTFTILNNRGIGRVLTSDVNGNGTWQNISGGGGITGATNVGSGVGIYTGITANQLRFKSLLTSGGVFIDNASTTLTIRDKIGIISYGTKNTSFNISLSGNSMHAATLTSTGGTITINFTNLLNGEGTINVIRLNATNDVTLAWNANNKWYMGNALTTILSGEEYRLSIATDGNTQSNIYIQYMKFITA